MDNSKEHQKVMNYFSKNILNETPEIIYPTQYVMRSSDEQLETKTTLRVTVELMWMVMK